MKINFGIVKKYFTDRGFGFINHVFLNPNSKEVFFHIKTIKQSNIELAKKIDNEDITKAIYFWYETENSKKGEQISTVLNHEEIHQKYSDYLPAFIEKVESLWKNIDLKTSEWLVQISIDLIGVDRTSELKIKKDDLKLKRNEEDEKKRKEEEALQKIENIKHEKLRREEKVQQEIEHNEFEQLIAEITPLGFTHSSQVSSYIMKNKLGYKYKNISGIIKMECDGRTWKFKGGFPPIIYAQICSKLGLGNQGSYAKVVGFNSFKLNYKLN